MIIFYLVCFLIVVVIGLYNWFYFSQIKKADQLVGFKLHKVIEKTFVSILILSVAIALFWVIVLFNA